MKEISLVASIRPSVGKGASRQARMGGNIPAVVYGPEIEPLTIAVEERAFRAATKSAGGFSSIIDLKVDGKSNKVIVRDVQRDPVTSKIIHLDFYAVSMKKAISISIPIHFVGTARGVKTDGGIMQTTMRELEISCLPSDIPEHVEVDVDELGIGDSIHVRALTIPKVQILSEARRTVVVISAPTVMKVEAAVEEEAVVEEEAEVAEAPAEEGEAKAEEKKDEKKDEKKEEKKGKKK